MSRHIEYLVNAIPIDTNGQPIQADCVDIAFVNYGTTTLVVNNSIRVTPPATAGQYNIIAISGNIGEIDRTKYVCRFEGVGTNNAVVIRRQYK